MLGDVILIRFQNISCYCLTTTCRFFVTCFLISKHLMLLFNSLLLQSHSLSSFISKHLMLLFNVNTFCPLSVSFYISKHLMLLFNAGAFGVKPNQIKFQNISCYCLTIKVTVEDKKAIAFQNISCYCLTLSWLHSLVNLWNFKTSHVIV